MDHQDSPFHHWLAEIRQIKKLPRIYLMISNVNKKTLASTSHPTLYLYIIHSYKYCIYIHIYTHTLHSYIYMYTHTYRHTHTHCTTISHTHTEPPNLPKIKSVCHHPCHTIHIYASIWLLFDVAMENHNF